MQPRYARFTDDVQYTKHKAKIKWKVWFEIVKVNQESSGVEDTHFRWKLLLASVLQRRPSRDSRGVFNACESQPLAFYKTILCIICRQNIFLVQEWAAPRSTHTKSVASCRDLRGFMLSSIYVHVGPGRIPRTWRKNQSPGRRPNYKLNNEPKDLSKASRNNYLCQIKASEKYYFCKSLSIFEVLKQYDFCDTGMAAHRKRKYISIWKPGTKRTNFRLPFFAVFQVILKPLDIAHLLLIDDCLVFDLSTFPIFGSGWHGQNTGVWPGVCVRASVCALYVCVSECVRVRQSVRTCASSLAGAAAGSQPTVGVKSQGSGEQLFHLLLYAEGVRTEGSHSIYTANMAVWVDHRRGFWRTPSRTSCHSGRRPIPYPFHPLSSTIPSISLDFTTQSQAAATMSTCDQSSMLWPGMPFGH